MALGLTPQQILEKGNHSLLVAAPHWERVFLGEIATVQNGAAFKSRYFTQDDGLPLIRIRDVGKTVTDNYYNGPYDDDYLVYPGEIIIGMDGDFNAAFWSGDVGLLNQRVCRLKIRSNLVDRSFLLLCLQPFLDAINTETSSVTVKHLSSRTVAQIPLPLPPCNEQRRIVAKIEELFSELDNGVETLKAARAQLKTYRQSLLKAAFEGRLTEQWRYENADTIETADQLLRRIEKEREVLHRYELAEWERAVLTRGANGKPGKKPKKPSSPKSYHAQEDLERSGLPEEWSWVRLGELVTDVKNGLYKPAAEYGSGCGIVRIDDFYDGKLRGHGVFKRVRVEPSEKQDYALRQGDLLVNRVNSIEYLGKTGLVEAEHEGLLFESNMMRLRFVPKVVDPRLYAIYLSTRAGYSAVTRNAKHAVNQASINQTDVLTAPVPLLSKSEADALLSVVDACVSEADHLEKNIDVALERCSRLRSSILKRAFEGKLVPQDPDDEPASVLLERIEAEQEKEPKSVKGRRKANA